MKHTPDASNPWPFVQQQDNRDVPGGNNMFNMLLEQEDKEEVNAVNDETTVNQTAALTTGSTLGNTYGGAATMPFEITTKINQLAVNQVAI